MAITSDWHIHTKCSCDSACMEFETLVAEAKRLGITDFGVSDHYHTRIQESGIKIAMGSDCHKARLGDAVDYCEIEKACKTYGIKTNEFFCIKK